MSHHFSRTALTLACLLLSGFARGEAVPQGSASAVAPLVEAIRERVDHLRYELDHDPRDHALSGERIVLGEAVARYYEAQQFQPQWRDPARLGQLADSILDLVNDGLEPSHYHFDQLDRFRAELRVVKTLPDAEQARLEILATDAMMLALYHLYAGKVHPDELDAQWNFAARPIHVERGLEALGRALATGAIRETFERARPQHTWYQQGRERLKEYRALAAAGGWPAVPDGPSLKPGMQDSRVPALRARLEVTHDVEPGAGSTRSSAQPDAQSGLPSGAAPDLSSGLPPELYDAALETAVKRFQERHGLAADGVVGPATRAAMNVPVETRIDQMRVNLERARWVLHEIKGEFALVDVAGFDVSYFRDDQPVWTSKVIVGRPYRETPIFKSLITYVVFNPTWTIPPGILVKDKLPVIQRDPGYLARNAIRVLDSAGREVDPYSVDWGRYGPSRLPPYQLRQDPGDDNALGRVKIMFPNPHMVYLHDTPTKSLFDRDQRTFSSGCIRVDKAMELAELVLNDAERWNAQAMAEAVATGETRTVTLAKPVPVLILYWTAQPLPDGQVMFRNDVYGRDAATLAALDRPLRP